MHADRMMADVPVADLNCVISRLDSFPASLQA